MQSLIQFINVSSTIEDYCNTFFTLLNKINVATDIYSRENEKVVLALASKNRLTQNR